MRILVVEDDAKTARFLKQRLEEEGHAIDVAGDGDEGAFLGHLNRYDLVVLDVQLPRRNGLQLAAEFRREGIETPILMLTARDSTPDIIRGLNSRTQAGCGWSGQFRLGVRCVSLGVRFHVGIRKPLPGRQSDFP